RICERHADLDDVSAGLRQRLDDVERRFGIGITGHQEGDERRTALFGEFGKSCIDTGGHFFLPFRISVICGMSLSPRPERLTTIRWSRGRFGASSITLAIACAGSRAGGMPSSRVSN